VKYVSASGVPTSDWDLVRAVQVSLLMRAATTESGYQNNTSYNMVGTTYTVNDSYPRLLMSSVIQQRN
jgi:hypothetical protein